MWPQFVYRKLHRITYGKKKKKGKKGFFMDFEKQFEKFGNIRHSPI